MKGTWENATWEFKKGPCPDLPVVSVCGVLIQDDKILLTLNDRGWSLTGGHVEIGETPEEALKREMLEEGGVTVDTYNQFGYYYVHYDAHILNKATNTDYPREAIIPFYMVTTKEPLIAVSKESLDAQWFSIYDDEVPDLVQEEAFWFLINVPH